MHKLLFIIGLLMTISGLFWACQGLGYIQWPTSSFMVNQVQWSYYGGGFALAGLFVIWLSRR